MEYAIADRYGFALITEVETQVTVIAVPLPLGEKFFAFTKVQTCDTYEDAMTLVAAMFDAGHRPEDYYIDDLNGEQDDNQTTQDNQPRLIEAERT